MFSTSMASLAMNRSKALYAVVALVAALTVLVTVQLMTSQRAVGRDVIRRVDVQQQDGHVVNRDREERAPGKENHCNLQQYKVLQLLTILQDYLSINESK